MTEPKKLGVHEEHDIEKSFDFKIMKKLSGFTKPYMKYLIICALLLITVTMVDLIKPYLIKVVIDDHIKNMNKAGIFNLTMIYLGLVIAGFFITYVQMLLLNWVSQKLVYDMRAHLFDHLLKLPLSFYDKNPVGRLVTRVTNDMKNISDMYTDVLINLLNDVLLLIGTLVIMLSLNWKLALISLCTFPLVTLSAYWFRIKAREAHRSVKAKIARINAVLSENISGMRMIQLFDREKEVYDEFDEINADHLKSSMKEIQVFGTFRPSMNLIYTLALTLLIWYAGGKVLQGSIQLGMLFAFINYTDQFFKPIFDLSEKFNILQSAMASSERVFMLLEENEHEEAGEVALDKAEVTGRIQFKDVCFEYLEGEPVLKNINLDIEAGETVAIVGATGSGKTTIISLLSGLYPLKTGDILIDGHSVTSLRKSDLRKLIGVVLQDVFLFAGQIKDNISLGDEGISDQKVIDTATFVNAHTFIEKLPNQYDETVYERGTTLSTGQRQLLSFARALAYDPKILILDEATSSIDTETEHLIQDAIGKLTQNRTTIIIAHRLSTIKDADKIVVLHKGEVREVGSHDVLMARGGLYYDLYRLQYQEA
jgi:ATP-binding cassette subfamily B multidrug efflux pump